MTDDSEKQTMQDEYATTDDETLVLYFATHSREIDWQNPDANAPRMEAYQNAKEEILRRMEEGRG